MKKYILTVFVFFFGFASFLFAQDASQMPVPVELNGDIISIIRCGTVDNAPDWVQRAPEDMGPWRQQLQQRSPAEVIEIPVVFHVITHENGSGTLSTDAIEAQIDTLNSSYAPYNIQFTLQDILPYENTAWYNDPWTNDYPMKNELAVDPTHTLNIYTAGMTTGESDGLLGWAYFPWSYDESNVRHGLVIHYQSLPGVASWIYGEGKTAVHEIGHYLGLYHTFQGGCVNGPNSGDYCEDTPAQYDGNNIYQCDESLDTCPTDPGNDPVHNYMNYTDDACLTEFTPDQGARIEWAMETYKPSLGNILYAGDDCEGPLEIAAIPANINVDTIEVFNNDYGSDDLVGAGWSGKDIVFSYQPEVDIDIHLTISAEYDNMVGIFADCGDPSGTIINAVDANSTAPFSETINTTLSAGQTYYIVNGAKNLFGTGATTLTMDGLFACEDDTLEDNDVVADAADVTAGSYDLTLCPADTNANNDIYDIFSIDVPANTVLTARAEWTNDSDVDLYLMAPTLASDQYVDHSWYDTPEVVSYANPSDQPVEFLVAVNLYSGMQPTDYTLTLEQTDLQQDVPRNLTATPNVNTIDLRWDPPLGPNQYLTQIAYHDSIATDAVVQDSGKGYGVVFDLQSYADATFESIDFNYTGRQTVHGPYYYNLHLYDWTADTMIASFDSLTVADAFDGPTWESDVSLSEIDVSGVSYAGIFIEPLSGDAADAYPALSTDSSVPADSGKNYEVTFTSDVVTDSTDLRTTSYGDFLMNLTIATPAGEAIAVTSLGTKNYLPTRRTVTSEGHSLSGARRTAANVSYNLYRNSQLLDGNLNDSTYADAVIQADSLYSYRVTALFDSGMESDSSNLATAMVTGIDTTSYFTALAPDNEHEPMQLNITKALRRGVSLQSGDEIGVFRNDTLCYATATLSSEISPTNPLQIDVPSDNPFSGVIDGFLADDTLSFRIWDSTDSVEVSSVDIRVRTGSQLFTANSSATIELYGLNMAPVYTGSDSLAIPEDSSATIPLEAVDSDRDSLTFTAMSDTSAVTAEIQDSSLAITPNANWAGEAIISVTVSDGELSNVGFITVTVIPQNDPPNDFSLRFPYDSTEVNLDGGTANSRLIFEWQPASDPDGDTVRYSMQVTSGDLSPIVFTDTTVTTVTYMYDVLIDLLDEAGTNYIEGEWTIVATDGQDSVVSVSEPRFVVIDGTLVGIDQAKQLPKEFSIGQNYPNPFNPTTTIEYGLPKEANVNIRVYDILGHEIATLVHAQQAAGYYAISWDGKNNAGIQVASGVYMYMISAQSMDGNSQFSRTRKLLLIR